MTTFVLVPGAWLGGWVWKKVAPLLERNGHQVYPMTLTGMGDRVHLASKELGMETAVQDVLNTIEFEDLEDVVLAGHSFAGKEVRLLLYVDAFRPRNIRTPQGNFGDEWKHVNDWKIPLTQEVLDAVGRDIKGDDLEWMTSKATPWPLRYAADPITLSEKFDRVSKAYILCTEGGDDVQQILKEKLDGPFRVIESGHWPMITKSEELAEDMLSLAGP